MTPIKPYYLNNVFEHLGENNLSYNPTLSETYGEILPESINKLISQIQINPQDIFFDLGSGIGKVTAQFFLNSPVKESWGIELRHDLHLKALAAKEVIKNDLPNLFLKERKLIFQHGDFLESSLSKATILMICAPCFEQNTLLALGKKIENAPNIHTVLSLRPLGTLRRLPFKKAIRIECSWDAALCYLYTKIQ